MSEKSPFDPNPRALHPDPDLGTRDGWAWCSRCGGIKPPGHVHSCNLHLDCLRADAMAPAGIVLHCTDRSHLPLCTCGVA